LKKFSSTLILIAIFSTLLFSFKVFAEISPEQLKAKEKGIELYNQFKAISATPYLKIAAEAGDHEAQYYLAEALRKNNKYMTPEAQSAYEASALQGDIYSMIRLAENSDDLCVAMENCPKSRKTPKEWLNMATDAASAAASKGDAEAMYLMFRITNDDTWLEKSAENGYAFAQHYLASGYQGGKGFFLLPSSRAEVIERLMKSSAEGGYPQGMMSYAAIRARKKDFDTFRYWNEQAAKTGYASAVFGYGSYLSENPSKFGFPHDLTKSYALIYSLLELDGGGGVKDYAEDILPEIATQMTAEQIETAKKLSKEWKESHPPLSYFPDKL
jgi:hypothetical protein